MSIALIAKDNVPLAEIGDRLAQAGVRELFSVKADAILNRGQTVDQADSVFLISFEHDLEKAGALTSQVREKLGQRQRLTLCMLRPNDSQLLFDQGADEIISPAGLTVERITERILGHLILGKHIVPFTYVLLRGATPQMQKLYKEIEEYALLTAPVLIRGESGTGKELVADAVRKRSPRNGAWSSFNCAEFSPELIQNELFGHVKGSFTGAINDHIGLIEKAKGGTVFLDEIGELELPLQAKLLRALEQNEVRPVGANHYIPVNARFIFATNRNLEGRIAEGKFSNDLFQRIRVLPLELPRLNEHLADIPLLVEHFIEEFNSKEKRSVKIQADALDVLFRHDWPGNVRELHSVIYNAAAKSGRDGTITDSLLIGAINSFKAVQTKNATASQSKNVVEFDPQSETWHTVEKRTEAAYFKSLIEETGDRKRAIELSGMRRAQFYKILKEHGLSF